MRTPPSLAQLHECWKRAHTPLAYRSKFWLLFDGSGFLHVAVHEDELLRLWRDLGVFNSEAGRNLIHGHMDRQYSTLSSSPSSADGELRRMGSTGSSSPGGHVSADTADILSLYSASSSVNFYRRFACVEAQLDGVEGGRPVFSSELAAAKGDRGDDRDMMGKHLVVAAERLKLERQQLYEKMKYSNTESMKAAYYSMFGVKDSDKKKKQTLTAALWDAVDLASESAQVVLGVGANQTDTPAGTSSTSLRSRFMGSPNSAHNLSDAGSWVQQKVSARASGGWGRSRTHPPPPHTRRWRSASSRTSSPPCRRASCRSSGSSRRRSSSGGSSG